jgi:two-component system chemotaxis sensor kinase CheA
MSRYLDLFLSETRDHLTQGEDRLEEINRGERGQPIHDLFRHVHSVKGMAASMGFGHITDFAHRLEDLLDRLREETIAPDDDLLDLVRRGLDQIAAQVDAIEAEQPPVEADAALLGQLQARLDVKTDDSSPEPAPPPAPAPAAKSEAPRLRIEIGYARTTQLPGARALVALARLESLGTVLDVDPPREKMRGDSFLGRFRVRLATAEPLDAVRSRIERFPDVASVNVVSEETEKKTADNAAGNASTAIPSTVRVKTEHLDSLLEDVGELIVHRSLLRGRLGSEPQPEIEEQLDTMASLVSNVHETVLAMRLLPFETIAHRLSRSVRELARDLGKKARFEIRGRQVGLDRSLLEELLDPLQHIFRNALDHGLEPPDTRREMGKPETGSLILNLERKGDAAHVTVTDDGRGMDPDALRKAALERGVVSEEALGAMADEEVLLLVTRPGFSTADRATTVSGRGVGMDVVRTRIEGLGGHLALRSRPGQGTTVHLALPLTISVIESLLVEVGGETFAVPSTAVQRTGEIDPAAIQVREGLPHTVVDGQAVPLRDLATLLDMDAPEEPFTVPRPVFLFREGTRRAGMAVDRILGLREMVIKPLGRPLELVPGLSGATILDNGRVALILDLAKLLAPT